MASFVTTMRNKKGITLIELIVTMGLIAVIIGLAFSSYILGTRTFVIGNEKYDLQFDARSVTDFITNELRNATEIDFDEPGEPGKYNVLYAATDKKLKYKPAGLSEKDMTGALFQNPSDLMFEIKSDSRKNVLTFILNGINGSQSMDIETDIVLNNIASLISTNGVTYNKIYYLKPSESNTAEAVAAQITSIPDPLQSMKSIMLPGAPSGYSVQIKPDSINPGGIIGEDCTIEAPLSDTTVSMKLTVTKLSDGKTADTAEITVLVPKVLTPQDVADSLTSIAQPPKDATRLLMPIIPAGFSVAVKSSSDLTVIGLDGTIIPPDIATEVTLVLSAVQLSTGLSADTQAITVIVPAKTVM